MKKNIKVDTFFNSLKNENKLSSTWGGNIKITNYSEFSFIKKTENSHQMSGTWKLPNRLISSSPVDIRVEFENSVTINPLADYGFTTYQAKGTSFTIYAKGSTPVPIIGVNIENLNLAHRLTISPLGEIGVGNNSLVEIKIWMS